MFVITNDSTSRDPATGRVYSACQWLHDHARGMEVRMRIERTEDGWVLALRHVEAGSKDLVLSPENLDTFLASIQDLKEVLDREMART